MLTEPLKKIRAWLSGFQTFRPPDVYPPRQGIVWLLMAAVAVLALHVVRLPSWVPACYAAILVWRYFIETHGWRIPGRLLRYTLLFSATVAVWLHFHTVIGRDAGVTLLLILASLKILEMRTVRDCMLSVFLLYFCTLTAFLFNQQVITGTLGLLVAILVTVSLVKVSQPASLALSDLRRDIAGMIALAVPLMVVIYLLFPRIQGSLWGLPEDAFAGRTGLTDEVSPGSISELQFNDEVAFRVEFDGEVPDNGKLYWRAMVLGANQGRSWRKSAFAIPTPLEYRQQSARVDYTVTYEANNRNWLSVLDLPALQPPETWLKHGYTFEFRRPLQSRRTVKLVSYLEYRTGLLDRITRLRSLDLKNPVSERTRSLIDGWLLESADVESLVARALDHFSNEGFYYTLTPPLLGADPVDEFLFETRQGYCEHYASAFTSLMRAGGIPARMVVGYQGGEWNEAGGYLIVRQSDAHAWSEVWSDDRGWMRVDPTFAVAPERINLGFDVLRALSERGAAFGNLQSGAVRRILRGNWFERQAHNLVLRWDAVNNQWNHWIMAYGPENQRAFLEKLGFSSPSWGVLVGLLLTVLTGLLGIYALGLLRHHRNRDPLMVVYQRFCDKMSSLGVQRMPNEGPVDFARRCIAANPQLENPIGRFITVYIQSRYGMDTDEQAVARLKASLRAIG